MATSGQTLNDRINAARYALAGQGLARCVCKATTEEIIGPKKKHLDYLLACTHEPNVSIPQLANLLIERTNHIYWVVVFKALVTVHHLMSYGNERFTQYLASSNYSFELSTFLDKTAARDFSMSTFIRRYSRYINEKALSYRLLAFDLCKAKRGQDGVLGVMPIDRLLKTLPILQNQLDALLEFDCSASDLNNGVINACFMLLFRDLIGLFACHHDGIINLLDKYFNLNRKMCRESFELYKKFLVQMDKVSEFLRVAEVVGIDKKDIPDLRKAPGSLIDAMEQHLQNIESKPSKGILKSQQSGSNINNNSLKLSTNDFLNFGGLTPPSSRRISPGDQQQGVTSKQSSSSQEQSDTFSIASFKDEEVRKALEEEARVLSQYGTTDSKSTTSNSLIAPPPAPQVAQNQKDSVDPLDFFSAPSPFDIQAAATTIAPPTKSNGFPPALKPGNPFPDLDSDFASSASLLTPVAPTSVSSAPVANQAISSSIFKSGTTTANYTNLGALEGFGDLLQPMSSTNKAPGYQNAQFGQTASNNKPSFAPGAGLASTGLFKGDLDSTLANLAQNLTLDGISKTKK